MPAITDTVAELTPSWFTESLRDSGAIAQDTTVTAVDCVPFGVGQTARLLRAALTYDGGSGPATAIVKQPSDDESRRGLATALGFYRAEVCFYEEVAPRVDVASPRVYWSALEEETGRFTLVLEDLSETAESGDMLDGATPERAALAVSELTRLQAPLWNDPWIYEREWLSDASGTRMFYEAAGPAAEPFIERFGDGLDDDQIDLVRRLASKGSSIFEQIWRPPFVVMHGDYRLDNMMFGTSAGAPPISLVDWQVARAAPPGVDLASFLATCVDVETRRATERDHIDAWVDRLKDAGVAGFTFDDAWRSYQGGALHALLLCIAAAAALGQTERDNRLWRQISRGTAALVADTQAETLIAQPR